MQGNRSSRRQSPPWWLLIAASTLGLIVIVGIIGSIRASALPSLPPPDAASQNTPPAEISAEVLRNAGSAVKTATTSRVELSDGFTLNILSGPATRGVEIYVGGIPLRLPDDAQLDGVVARAEGKQTLPLPVYLVARSDGLAAISQKTGEFMVVRGPRDRFAFLQNQLGSAKEIRISR